MTVGLMHRKGIDYLREYVVYINNSNSIFKLKLYLFTPIWK